MLRAGVLGAGPISQAAHFEACQKARNVRLHAVCDHASDLLEAARGFGPEHLYRNYDEMLADRSVDAVLIATADQFHVEQSLAALRAGKHVLVEKPLGVSVEEAEQLRAAVEQSGLVLQVGHNRRFDPGVVHAHAFVREELGQMQFYRGWYRDSTSRYDMTDNLQPVTRISAEARRPEGDPKQDRQKYFLLTHGSHLLDTARYLGGPIRGVRARHSQAFGAHCWFVELTFDSGALGHAELTVPYRGDFEEGFEIGGEFGSVKGRLPLTWYHKCGDVESFSVRDGFYRRPLGADAFSYRLQVESFADVILHGAQQRGANVHDGLACVRTLVAIARSIAEAKSVEPAQVTGGL